MARGKLPTAHGRSARKRAVRIGRGVFDFIRGGNSAPTAEAPGIPADPDPGSPDAQELGGLRTLLPSLGLFGGIEANHLKITLDEPLKGLLISLPDDRAGRLDLRGVQLASQGRRVGIALEGVRAWQSSYANGAMDAEGAFSLRSIRTEKEAGAWWTASFDPPLQVDEIRVLSRMDGRGVSSRRLRVSVRGDDGWRVIEDAFGVHHVTATLALLTRLTDVPLPPTALKTVASARNLRPRVLDALARKARTALLTSDAEEQRLLLALLPTVPSKQVRALTDDEWTLLAHLLAAERKRVHRSATSFRLFSRVLTSRESLERLHRELNCVGPVLGLGPMSLTRHGVCDLGQLRQKAEIHISLMIRVQDEFAKLGLPIMLGYGTLLGAVREGDFLENDDDIDLLYPVEAKSIAEAQAHTETLCEKLAARGFRIWRNESRSALNFHLTDPKTACHVDVFPVLLDGDIATLHMERMKLRAIPRALVVPARPLTFRGAELLGPADPEGFLAERYGTMWTVPDPYHDWIWPLSDPA